MEQPEHPDQNHPESNSTVGTTQDHIQQHLQRQHEELQNMIVHQQEELRRVSEQLTMARYGLLPPWVNVSLPLNVIAHDSTQISSTAILQLPSSSHDVNMMSQMTAQTSVQEYDTMRDDQSVIGSSTQQGDAHEALNTQTLVTSTAQGNESRRAIYDSHVHQADDQTNMQQSQQHQQQQQQQQQKSQHFNAPQQQQHHHHNHPQQHQQQFRSNYSHSPAMSHLASNDMGLMEYDMMDSGSDSTTHSIYSKNTM